MLDSPDGHLSMVSVAQHGHGRPQFGLPLSTLGPFKNSYTKSVLQTVRKRHPADILN